MIKLKLLTVLFFVLQFEGYLLAAWPCATDFTSRFKRALLDLENYLVDLTAEIHNDEEPHNKPTTPALFRKRAAPGATTSAPSTGAPKTVQNCKKRAEDEAYTDCGVTNCKTFIPAEFVTGIATAATCTCDSSHKCVAPAGSLATTYVPGWLSIAFIFLPIYFTNDGRKHRVFAT